jgi:integrase
MAKREVTPVAGLYKNGTRWWVRTVRAPLVGTTKSLSTGTTDTARANRIKALVDEFATNPTQYEWLSLAVAGEVSLDQLYTHHAAGTLATLREQLKAAKASDADADLDPIVTKWEKEHLATLGISQTSKDNYLRQVRKLIPAGVRFPASKFNEDTLKATLAGLTGARHDREAVLSGGAKRRHVVAWQLFYKYARKRGPIFQNPFEDADWIPANGSPRSTFYEFDKVQKVLQYLEGEDKVAAALVFGSGIELGALLNMKGAHIGSTLEDGRGMIVAPGSKNEHREDRSIFVDAWAWKIITPHTDTILPRGSLWSYNPKNGGKELRDAFYNAQVRAGFIDAPTKNPATGKELWGRVKPHTIHDARHSYCINRSLGLDGEEAQDAAFCANQLGHADETMVLKIYKKANVKERLRLIQQQQIRKAATKAAGEGR